MKDSRGRVFEIGDTVSVPLDGEEMYSEQVAETFEVVMALRHKDGRMIYPINEMGIINNSLE
jgi:hypothetical protein